MFSYKKLDDDEIIKKVTTPINYNYIDIFDPKNPKNHCIVLECYLKIAEKIKNFEVYEDDVWAITGPKSGTTWIQELVWILNNNLDFKTALSVTLDKRFPFIEFEGVTFDKVVSNIEIIKNLPRPRHIKSHLPVFLLPNQLWSVKPKIIFTVRNPKDVAISYYHHYRHVKGYTGTKEDFLNAFLNDKVLHSPMNDRVLEFWKLSKENSNILFIHYEDMKRNLENEVKKVAKFLGKEYNHEEIDKVCQHLSFESMRKNPMLNYETLVKMVKEKHNFETVNEEYHFIREGQVGSYKKEMSEEEMKRFDEYVNNPELKKHGFEYKS